MRIWFVGLLAVLTTAAAAHGHDDVVPYELNGKIATGGHDDLAATNNVEQRVFGLDFGEDPLDPYVIGDPGFNNGAFAIGVFPGDGLLPQNFTLGIDVATHLEYWDGAGSVSFGAAPADVALGLKRGTPVLFVTGSGTSGTVPTIGSTGAGGRLHVHTESQLHATDGTNPAAPNAPGGVYLVGLKLTLAGSGLADSDPIYLVYNNGLDEEVHDLAIDWVETNLVPEPASWALMATGLAVLAAGLRKRKARLAAPWGQPPTHRG